MTGTIFLPAGPDQAPVVFLPCTEADLPHIIKDSLALLAQVQTQKGMDLSILEQLLLKETLKELPDYTKLVRGDQLLGWYHLIRHEDHLELDDLNILKPWRGQGLGSLILERLKAQAKGAALPLRCTVLKENQGALRLYARHDFLRLGEEGRYVNLVWRPLKNGSN